MKKIRFFLLSFAVACLICICGSIPVYAVIYTGSGTEADPYRVSTDGDLKDVIMNSPTNNMTGTPTYIRLDGDTTYAKNFKYEDGRNIDLNLNGHTLETYEGFCVFASRLNIYNGTVKCSDKSSGSYASTALEVIKASVLHADRVTFQGGNGVANNITGGYGVFIDYSSFTIKNCTISSGNSYGNGSVKTALYISASSGTICNTTLKRGAGTDAWYYTTLNIFNSQVTDADGNLLSSSQQEENEVFIPKAYADTPVTEEEGSKTFSAKGTYQASAQAGTVYSVDVTWGSMEFTYTEGGTGTWDPLTHEYGAAAPAGWSWDEDANKITVINRSNAAIDAGLSYTNGEGFNLTTKFTDSETNEITKLSLPTAEAYGETAAGARAAAAYFNITDGALAANTAANTSLGTITVTISDAE